jgi:beta-N-acetylhexosaminidase
MLKVTQLIGLPRCAIANSDVLAVSKNPEANIVFISPGKTPSSGGAVESGEEKTREQYTPDTYFDLLRIHNPSIINIRFHDSINLSSDAEKAINEADTLIFATRNASLSSYQKNLGLLLGKKFGKKLIVIATCDPYDFLKERDEVKNYVAIYEPTIPAFKSAVNVMFGATKALGILPVGHLERNSESFIRLFDGSERETDHIWRLWKTIFPSWFIGRERLARILTDKSGRHFVHDVGFFLSFVSGGQAKIATIGVLPENRGKGIGTTLINKAIYELKLTASDSLTLGIGSQFPRLWPGVPVSMATKEKDFFLHRGICVSSVICLEHR